ncbi:terpene synthase family protein [Streptomyces cyaneus]|uniref:terpene synthase family protein n=1 Tax=Streptomyces cyaneus TaxID=1904 RepID=UPI000FF8B799|nr:hypothetical protein [Streptomyces cyaneus]
MGNDPIPVITLPFPVRKHPMAEAIETHTRRWAHQFGLARSEAAVRTLACSRFGEFGAYAYPAVGLVEAQLAADWLGWLFIADDQLEVGNYGTTQSWREVTQAVRGVLEPSPAAAVAGPMADAPLIRALDDISHRLDQLGSPAWKKRFARHFMEAMAAAAREIDLRDRKTAPRLFEYAALRREAGGVIPCFDLIEICRPDSEVPADVHTSASFREFVATATDIVSWTNDLRSVDKEVACGIMSNIVLVLQHQGQLSREQALGAAHALIDDRIKDLLAAEHHLSGLVDDLALDAPTQEALRWYVAGVRDWIAGSNHWHSKGTDRFLGAGTEHVEDLLDPHAR